MWFLSHRLQNHAYSTKYLAASRRAKVRGRPSGVRTMIALRCVVHSFRRRCVVAQAAGRAYDMHALFLSQEKWRSRNRPRKGRITSRPCPSLEICFKRRIGQRHLSNGRISVLLFGPPWCARSAAPKPSLSAVESNYMSRSTSVRPSTSSSSSLVRLVGWLVAGWLSVEDLGWQWSMNRINIIRFMQRSQRGGVR